MNRRDFLTRAALVATGAIAADQLELLERLTHRRRFFAGIDFGVEPSRSALTVVDQHGRLWSATENFHFEAWSMSRVTGKRKRLV